MSLRSFPIDTGRLAGFVVMSAPRARIDSATGAIRPDREGRTVFLVGVAVKNDDDQSADVLELQLTSDVSGIAEGMIVEVGRLQAVYWTRGDGSGVSWRAQSIRAASAGPDTMLAPAPSPVATAGPAAAPVATRGKAAGGEQS